MFGMDGTMIRQDICGVRKGDVPMVQYCNAPTRTERELGTWELFVCICPSAEKEPRRVL